MDSLGFNYAENRNSKDINRLFELDDNGVYSLKINDNLYQLFTEDYLTLKNGFERELGIFFQDSSEKLFRETKLDIKFTKNEVKSSIKKFIDNIKNKFGRSLQFSLDKDTIRVKSEEEIFDKQNVLPHQVALNIVFDVKKILFPTPFLLPAERNALIITYKTLETRRYDLLKNADRETISQSTLSNEDSKFLQRKNIRYPQPIEDFLNFLTNLEISSDSERKEFSNFATIIEKELQSNNKTKYIPTELEGKEIKISLGKNLEIDLHNASSSIKQLAPLLLYLRYRAQKGGLLIIDEPEMNLHPESQAKLLEVLGMLVNAGVNVLLTTHSPYFMSHLNNLIAGDMTDDATREKQAKSLYLEDDRAFLKPEDVSAYEMRQNKKGEQTLHDLHDKDYGIRWDTLSDVSADIQQKFFEIYEKAKETSNGRKK